MQKFFVVLALSTLLLSGCGMFEVYLETTPAVESLLVNETTSPTGGHLFIVNLNTLEQRLLQAPGLSLDTDWTMPSWRK